MRPIEFTSVHDYLDLLFEDASPNKEDIIRAKKTYWRAYNTDLKRRQREHSSILHITFSKEEYAQIKERLGKGENVSGYIRNLVRQHLEDNQDFVPKVNTALIEQQLFLIAEYLQELLDVDTIDTKKIEELEQHIRTLENLIHEVL